VEIDLQYEVGARVDTGKTNLQAGAPQEIAVSSVEMLIRDDGAGFNTGDIAAPGHYGLGMMHERAEAVKAQLTVTSQPGSGTEVRLCWPGIPKKEAL
jgi:nitrate/nitrite-specific signal transduction histidine kinase